MEPSDGESVTGVEDGPVTVVDLAENRAADDAGEHAETVQDLRRLARLLDSSIPVPGTNYRIGLDPLLGALPVAGDVPTTALSAFIVVSAAAIGVPRATLARMLGNVVLDAVVGSIPVVGDVFDAVWKANQRNVRLLERRVDAPEGGTADRRAVLAATAVLAAVLLGLGVASVLVIAWLLSHVGIVV